MKSFLLTSFLCFFVLTSFSQTAFQRGALRRTAFLIDSLPANGVLLDKNWKWHAGDNPNWAKPDFDDSKWDTLNPSSPFSELPQVTEAELSWFRLEIDIDSSLLNQPLIIDVIPSGALEINLNGKLVRTIGKVSKDPNLEVAFSTDYNPINFIFSHAQKNVISIRYSLTKSNFYFPHYQQPFSLTFRRLDGWSEGHREYLANFAFVAFIVGVFVIMALLHLFFYFFYPIQRANLLFSMALICGTFFALGFIFANTGPFTVSLTFGFSAINRIFNLPFFLLLLTAVYEYLQQARKLLFWGLVIANLVYLVSLFLTSFEFDLDPPVFYYIILLLTLLNYLYISYQSKKAGNQNGRTILYGGIFFFTLFFTLTSVQLYAELNHYNFSLTIYVIVWALIFLTMPISFSLTMARDFAQTSFSLQRNLEEVKQLSEEKQQILAAQNETLEKQVEQRTAELKAAQNQLIQKEKLASLGELTAGIAHEIQNPLNFVNNFSELSSELIDEMNEEIDKGDTREVKAIAGDLKQNLQKISHHGKRASSIVKGMLEHSRMSTGERELTDLNQLADEYLRLSYHGLRAKDNSFNSDYELISDESLPKINVVPQEIGRVLLNMINNAFYAVNERTKLKEADYKPKVTVTTKAVENQIQIQVQDNGTGMSDATKAKIFQPFFTTKPTGEGTGLGLSLAYDIVTKGHGGTIEVESTQGKGTLFTVCIPCTFP